MAQLVRAPPCHGGGREFESLLGRLYGIIAQLGEHLPYKQRVIGSSPIGPIKLNNMDGFPSGQRGQTVNLLQIASVVRIHLHPFSFSGIFSKKRTYHIQHNIAGWSSLEARRAHNPKVVGSNPAPATHT